VSPAGDWALAHDVFISYSSIDKTVADATCAKLESRGIRCWIAPRDIRPGDEWGSAIIHGIVDSRAFVLLFSANADKSRQVVREVERAVNRGIPVIPFRIENVMPTESMEYFINTPHWLDAFQPPLEDHLNYLADVIETILKGGDASTVQRLAPAPAPPARAAALLAPQNLIVSAAALVLFGAVVWFAASRFSSAPAPAPAPAATSQPVPQQQAAATPDATTTPAGPLPTLKALQSQAQGMYSSLQGGGDMGSMLAQLGVGDPQKVAMSMSDVDGIYQVLGCEGLVDTRNYIYVGAKQTAPALKQLQVSGKGYAIDTSALNTTARGNVDSIQDYGKRAACT